MTGELIETPIQTAIRQYLDKYGFLGIDAEFFIQCYEAAKPAPPIESELVAKMETLKREGSPFALTGILWDTAINKCIAIVQGKEASNG